MSQYKVYGSINTPVYVEVEAESEGEAERTAEIAFLGEEGRDYQLDGESDAPGLEIGDIRLMCGNCGRTEGVKEVAGIARCERCR